MDIEQNIQLVLDGGELLPSDIQTLNPEQISQLVDRLKGEAERYWRIDPHITVQYATAIVQLGDITGDGHIRALGMMVYGDSLRYVHQNDEAWALLTEAGELYRALGDDVGWARTRVGRLAICLEMNAAEVALEDAEAARSIFRQYGEYEKLTRLEVNAAAVFNYLYEFQKAIDKCHEVLELLETLGAPDQNTEIIIYFNLGYAHQGLGQLREALRWYEHTREFLVARGETLGIAQVDMNIVNIEQARGNNKKALQLLHQIVELQEQSQSLDTSKEMWHLIECYFHLNRFKEARDLARKVIDRHPADHENYDLAQTLLQLAAADAALGEFGTVFETLDRAEGIFKRLNATAWSGMIDLYRAQAALRGGNLPIARQGAQAAAEEFKNQGREGFYLTATLLAIRAELAGGQVEAARQMAHDVHRMARAVHLPHLRYDAHFLLGQIAEQSGHTDRARRHYQVATGVMERIQRSLVLTSRADFLADKQEAIQALLRLYLAEGRTEEAFAALERAKAGVWLGYLSQLDHLRWLQNARTEPLIDELTQLREEHHWFYQVAHDQQFREQQHVGLKPEQALHEATLREQRLRALTEQLYLQSSAEDLSAASTVTIADLQAHLSDDTLLIAYYSDGKKLWAFLLDANRLSVCELPQPVDTVEKLLDRWQSNINRALRTVPGSDNERMLNEYALPLAQQLHDALLRPFADRADTYKRLIIVPYGSLHYLPFNLLHDGQQYRIEQSEVAILPTASLLTRQPFPQKRGALALAYNWDGRLHHTSSEAQGVIERFGGHVYSENDATQTVLNAPPRQVLHISAHGQYRIDQPEFSYIQLADGPLYTDDLFQHDLRYELVTLSACETGRSRAAAGDELIGLGRGFLFAGAGALIASLWRVDETLTLELMDSLYQHLDSGASKAAALREAQLTLARAYPGLHPAFWGAFELIGSADPLTQTN